MVDYRQQVSNVVYSQEHFLTW